MFLLPEFNELNQLAKGPNGGFKKLNQEQLNSIRKNGTFDVPSANFPGKFHRWQVHNFLQKGYERSTQGLYNSLSFALRLIIVTAKNRFASNRFSVLSGLKVWKKIFVNTINLLVGLTVKVTSWNQVEAAVNFHFQKYLLAELTVDDSNKRAYTELCNKIFDFYTKALLLFLFFCFVLFLLKTSFLGGGGIVLLNLFYVSIFV